jgi:hypothetical protein
MLLGFFELIPALLLLFRRTTLLGAILMLPMTLSVFLINKALNLWESTQLLSSVFLVLNVLIFLFERENIKRILQIVVNKERGIKNKIPEAIINMIVLLTIAVLLIPDLMDYIKQNNQLMGDWYNQHPNEWILQKEAINDSTLPARPLKVYFGFYGGYSQVGDTVDKSHFREYELDEKNHSLQIFDRHDSSVTKYTYSIAGDSLLYLTRVTDSTTNTKLVQTFQKRVMHLQNR